MQHAENAPPLSFVKQCFKWYIESIHQGSYRSLKCLKVLEIHHWFFKALKSLKNSTFLIKVLKSP